MRIVSSRLITRRSDGRAALEAAKTEYALERVSLPMVVVDGKAYCGAKEMETSLAETALSWQETKDSEILYLYTPACESCARAAAVLETLPETVTVRRGESEFESKIVVRRVDASAEPALAAALFDAYAAPDEKRITPTVFYGDTYLSGADAIERVLPGAVTLGWAAGGVRVEAQARTAEKTVGAVSLMETVGAGARRGTEHMRAVDAADVPVRGAAGGQARGRAGRMLPYGKICLLSADRHGASGRDAESEPGLAASACARTAHRARRGDDSSQRARRAGGGAKGRLRPLIRNQLPGRLRGARQRAVAKATQGRVLAISAAPGLGFIVAAGEFLCAGQLYPAAAAGRAAFRRARTDGEPAGVLRGFYRALGGGNGAGGRRRLVGAGLRVFSRAAIGGGEMDYRRSDAGADRDGNGCS